MNENRQLPIANIKVIEISHMIMGPAVGVVLADLGADVCKIEPPGGDHTRRLPGAGAGYFPMYNRNKTSVAIDLKSDDGLNVVKKMLESADVLIENFRPGAMKKLGLGYDDVKVINPRLIYCSEKGFLDGPYDHRTALDEVAQMMGGLAYMTGPPGRPLRAGASVIDVMGGLFGVIGILAALEERHRTGCGQHIKSSLFESAVFLVGQHMAQGAVTGEPVPPMPVRKSAWAIYDLFETSDGSSVFIGVVSDAHWASFCRIVNLQELLDDERFTTNSDRVEHKQDLMVSVRAAIKQFDSSELMKVLEAEGLPFAPIVKPEDLFDDTHLNASEGLLDVELHRGNQPLTRLPALPLQMGGRRFGVRLQPPYIGQHSVGALQQIGLSTEQIQDLIKKEIVFESSAKRD
ncbi:MAG TPA: CaiB/BaiF CoA-transferase family protein [Woeseiaceae bacterium]|nr:CaiB/BaiF CoA-transferase family protein [Woeseiaceae bacterium]